MPHRLIWRIVTALTSFTCCSPTAEAPSIRCGVREVRGSVMFKLIPALSAALIAGLALVGFAADASAHHRRGHGCSSCGPFPPSYTYKTKTVHKHVTKYRDVQRTRYVPRPHPI